MSTTTMTVRDVARELQISVRLARQLIADGVIPSVTITERNRRVRRADFLAYIESLGEPA